MCHRSDPGPCHHLYVVPELRHFFVESLNSGTFLFLLELAAFHPQITVPWRFQRLSDMEMRRHFMESEDGVSIQFAFVTFCPVPLLVLLWRQIAKFSERTLHVEEMDVFIHGASQFLY